jgi:cytochrome P450
VSQKLPNHDLSEMKCPISLSDVDLFSPGAQEHWYEAYEILHNEAPVHKIPGEGTTPEHDAFILSKHEDITRVVKDPQRFPPGTIQPLKKMAEVSENARSKMNAMLVSMLTLRPNMELWRAHRQELTDPWVGPGSKRHKEMITKTVNGVIDNWINKDEVDFVGEFARPIPQIVLANVLGFPLEDIPLLAKWGEAQVAPYVYGKGHMNVLSKDQADEQFKLLDGFKEYVQDQVEDKRINPKDDMITFLTEVTYEALGRKLTDLEINGVVYAMVIGGLETTQYAIEQQAQLICENKGLFTKLKKDRSLIRQFTEEAMRMRSPTQGLSTRETSRNEVFQGIKVPKGSILHLRWGSANVDPDEFECPMELRLDRKAVTRHLTFSAGPRVCPGAGISRLEQVIAWNCIFDRLDQISYAKNNTFMHQPGIMLGTLELNLNFKKT